MNKPLTLQVNETEQRIVETLNEAKLPFYVLKTIIKNIYEDIERAENDEIQQYEHSLENETNRKE